VNCAIIIYTDKELMDLDSCLALVSSRHISQSGFGDQGTDIITTLACVLFHLYCRFNCDLIKAFFFGDIA